MRIKNTMLISFIVLSFSLIGLGCSSSGSSAIYDNAEFLDASELEDLKSKVEAVIPEEYKKSDAFWIEVEGEVGSLKLIIGLTDPSFADIDCREIAVYLAREVKDLDLGVGNFIVQFFSSMGTSEDLLAIEYLSIQDPETIDRPDVISYSGGTVDVQF